MFPLLLSLFPLVLGLISCAPPIVFVILIASKASNQMRVEAENGATAGKTALAKRAKELGLDAIHDTVHEMARDEARHGKAFAGLLKRYFGK